MEEAAFVVVEDSGEVDVVAEVTGEPIVFNLYALRIEFGNPTRR